MVSPVLTPHPVEPARQGTDGLRRQALNPLNVADPCLAYS